MARKTGSTIPIDWQTVETMLRAWADGSDVADALGISEQTLYRACQREKSTTIDEMKRTCRAGTRNRLRAAQLRLALGHTYTEKETETITSSTGKTRTRTVEKSVYQPPNASMLIFLGKNVLGQTDKADVTLQIANYTILGDEPEGMNPDDIVK
jgi:hypothetical protein